MTLTTHAIAGAALASAMPAHPFLAFSAGFTSHFLLDAIPHWDYPILSESVNPLIARAVTFNRNFFLDLIRIGTDAAIGLAASVLLFATPASLTTIAAGAIGGILPDPLQFISTQLKKEPLNTLQRFHMWIHSKRLLRQEGRHVLGICSQAALVVAIIVVAKYLTF